MIRKLDPGKMQKHLTIIPAIPRQRRLLIQTKTEKLMTMKWPAQTSTLTKMQRQRP